MQDLLDESARDAGSCADKLERSSMTAGLLRGESPLFVMRVEFDPEKRPSLLEREGFHTLVEGGQR